uniref:Uncharacterized protein n=1 Tax=Opuntia streptacantha TaxID=393608 RepID=A0A7C9CKV9_OPUST
MSISGCLCNSLSMYTYPTTKQDGLQLTYLYNLSKYFPMLMLGALTPWNTFKFVPSSCACPVVLTPTKPELGLNPPLSRSLSFLAMSPSNIEPKIIKTLGVLGSTSIASGCTPTIMYVIIP